MQAPATRSSWHSSLLFMGAVFGLFSVLPHTARAATVAVSSVYDENVNATNTVDAQAPGNSLSLAQFKTDVSVAFSVGAGGVIGFDTAGNTNAVIYQSTEGVVANYGSGRQLTIESSVPYNFRHFSSIFAISGNGDPTAGSKGLAPADTVTNTGGMRLNFASLTGGAPGEAVTTAGFTLLSRNGFGQSVTVNWFIDGQLTPYHVQTDDIAINAGADDTFFSFVAPANRYVTGFEILYGGTSGDRRYGIDDLGFITTSVPEPSRVLLLGLGISCLGLRRRRRP